MATKIAKSESKVVSANFQKETYLMVPPASIIVDETKNPRNEYGEIEQLMDSIIENGIRNPLKGFEKDGKIYLREGFRRMRAINLALEKGKKIELVPMIMEKQPLSEEERTLEFLINNDGKPFTMLEQAEVIRRLLNFGWKVTDVVKKTGKARGYIDNLILLTRITMKVQHAITEGKISAHAVIQIMQAVKGDAEAAAEEVETAIKAAKAAGKEKATPKHVSTEKVKTQSFGKFYKFVEEIANGLAGRKDVLKPREEVLSKLLVAFENGQTPTVVTGFFLDHSKATKDVAKTVIAKTTPVKKVEKPKAAKAPAKKKTPTKK